jgi:ubiquinone/menaquinone biosynthesis C-methylase UbiE
MEQVRTLIDTLRAGRMNMKDRIKTALRETFNAVAPGYDNDALRFFVSSGKYLASRLGLKGNENVLDVATGTGNTAFALAKLLPNGHVTGIDLSPGMLEQGRLKAGLNGINNVDFLEMDMQSMQTIAFASGQFDAAACAFGIFFVEDMEDQLRKIASMVKAGGTVGICNFHEDYFQPLRDRLFDRLVKRGVQVPPQTWKRIAVPEKCRTLFEKAGLRDIKTEVKNMGYRLIHASEWWDIIWNAGYRRMVVQLGPEDLENFRQETISETAELTGEQGFMLDIGVLFTTGRV